MTPNFLSPIQQVEGLLTRAIWFQNSSYRIFYAIWNSKFYRYVFQFSLISAITYATAEVLAVHPKPADPLMKNLFSYGIPPTIVLAGLILSALPVGVLAHYERRLGSRDLKLKNLLYSMLEEAAEEGTRFDDPAEVLQPLLDSLKREADVLYLVSPNGIYFLADKLRYGLENKRIDHTLKELAKSSSDFRTALYECGGDLHWLIPNTNLDRVKIFLEERAARTGMPAKAVKHCNRIAGKWLVGELRKNRTDRACRTTVHRIKCVPDYRLLMTSHEIYYQKFPTDAPGLTQPVVLVTKEEIPHLYRGMRALISSWCSDLED